MKKWEYRKDFKFQKDHSGDTHLMKDWAEKGWECFSIILIGDTIIYYFKRELPLTPEEVEGDKEQKPKLKNVPEKIYLVLGCDNVEIEDGEDFENFEQVGWAANRVSEADIEYKLTGQ